MRQSIQQLPQSLINRIAAGEVIERPASVVKELIENAIDAGATRIVVETVDGGRELVRVIDDGSGIPVSELPLAFAAHATSKLTSDEELFSIATMGFRGEALASIGSVSQARMISRRGSDPAYEIFNHGGAISNPQSAAGNLGTTIEVRNLFFNVPARRKFLKGAPTEAAYVSEAVLRTALAHPDIAFKLLNNGRTVLDLPLSDPTQRWLAAWPKEFHEQRLPLQTRDAEIRLLGLIGLPELARPTTKYQHVYLNGRPIRDKYIQHALREAYRGLTEPGRHPSAIILLTLPPGDVDVNVHPTKSEVRFKDSGRIHSLVLSGVREVLLGGNLSPRAIPRENVPSSDDRAVLQAQLAAFFKGGYAPADPPAVVPDAWQLAAPYTQPPLLTQHAAIAAPATAAPPPMTIAASPFHSAIQLHNSYLVAESDDGLIIIDQHALHERIMFEELKTRVTRGPLESQQMLVPQTFTASGAQVALLDQIGPLLARLGIEARSIGPGSVAVSAFPSFLGKLEPAEFVRELLERGEQQKLDLHEEALLHDVLDMMSCKAAVKAGDPLTPAEIKALLERRELVDRSSNCPHGRPTTLRLSLKDLEKQFKRTGF